MSNADHGAQLKSPRRSLADTLELDKRLFGISRRQLDTACQQPRAGHTVEAFADLVDERLRQPPVAAARGHDGL